MMVYLQVHMCNDDDLHVISVAGLIERSVEYLIAEMRTLSDDCW
jgi:hypothetical protein